MNTLGENNNTKDFWPAVGILRWVEVSDPDLVPPVGVVHIKHLDGLTIPSKDIETPIPEIWFYHEFLDLLTSAQGPVGASGWQRHHDKVWCEVQGEKMIWTVKNAGEISFSLLCQRWVWPD